MPVRGIDHVNIRTTDIARSARFYIELFGFEHRTAALAGGGETNWLHDAAGQPIIHLRRMAADGVATGAFDHVALRCTDKAATIARLEAHGIAFRLIEGVTPGVAQIFLRDPHGIGLELNFAEG